MRMEIVTSTYNFADNNTRIIIIGVSNTNAVNKLASARVVFITLYKPLSLCVYTHIVREIY